MKAVLVAVVVLVLSAMAFGLLGVAAIASSPDVLTAPVLERHPLDAAYVVDVPGSVPVANPLDESPRADPRTAARYDDGVEVKNAVVTPPAQQQQQPAQQPFQPWRPRRPWQVPASAPSQCSDGSCFSPQRGR